MTARFSTIARANRAARDVCLIACGVFLLFATPESLTMIGLSGFFADVWVASIGGGAAVSLIGLLTRRPVLEIYGSMSAGFGMLFWAAGAVFMPGATSVSYALAALFLSGTFGQVYRALYIAEMGGRV